jgi:hypothetical protein
MIGPVAPPSRLAWLMGLAAGAAVLASAASQARAGERLYVIAVGHNGGPGGQPLGPPPDDEDLRPLRFADDDAADVYSLFRAAGDGGFLLAHFDEDTRRKYPGLQTHPPTIDELHVAVREVAKLVAADRRSGATVSVVFFYSGHGFSLDGNPALAMQDGVIGTQLLYDEIISPLAAARVHVIVDACHAEAVVRPRDAQADIVTVAPSAARTYLDRTTLARFRSAGAIMATTRGARAHEWDVYGTGIFTHELVSGLRGGADTDGDGLVDYREIAAFLSAANREVADPRARLDSVIQPPRDQPRAVIIDLRRLSGVGRLQGDLARLGRFYVEDERGRRILDLHAEPGFTVTLALPAGRPLFIRSREGEIEVTLAEGNTLRLDGRTWETDSLAPRGAIEADLRRGLFAAAFGPLYFRRFLAREEAALLAVGTGGPAAEVARGGGGRRTAAWICLGAATGLAIGAVGFGAGATVSYRELAQTSWERSAVSARDRYEVRRNTAAALSAGAVSAGLAGLALWRRPAASLSLGVSPLGPPGLFLRAALP